MVKKLASSLIIFTVLFVMLNSIKVSAEGPYNAASRIEGILVLDVSRSMLSSDPNKISNEAIKMFVDMSSVKGDKIGVIAYGSEVVGKQDIIKIQSQQDKEIIKNFIDKLGKYPYTDMSVGLTEAVKTLDISHEANYFPLIVLLADGNNDLDKKKTKTTKQADDQIAQAVADAKSKGYPIYVIGLNADGKLNKKGLQNIADGTSGKFFETSNAADLPGILSEIFADHLKLKIIPIKDVIGTEEYQDIKITIPNESVLEANISLVSSKPVNLKIVDPSGKEQPIPSDQISLTKSKNYSMLKLINPIQGDWTLKVKGFPKDKIDINLVFNNDLQLKLTPLAAKNSAGKSVTLSSYLEDNGKKVTNKKLYESLKATLYVKDLATGQTEEIQLKAKNNGYSGQFKLGDSSAYELVVKAEGESFFRETKPQRISVQKAAGAVKTPKKEESVSKGNLFPWLYIAIGAAAAGLLLMSLVSIIAKKRKENRGFSGHIVVEIEDEVSGESSEPFIKKLKAFKGEFYLTQLFSLDAELKEMEQITFVPITENTLLLFNKSNIPMEIGGLEIDAAAGHRLRRNDKLHIRLTELNKSVYIKNAG